MPAQSRSQRRRQPVRSQQRRPVRAVPQSEPVDYALDYARVRHDLKRIALWSILLFAGMVAIAFFI